MKTLKKMLIGVVSVIMAMSMAAFAACGSTDNTGNGGNNNQTDGGNTEGGNEDGGNTGDTQTDEEKALAQLFEAVQNLGTSAAFQVDIEGKNTKNNYVSVDGEFGTEPDETHESEITAKLSVKMNIADGNADIVAESQQRRDKQTTSSMYGYAFIRDWNIFETSSDEKITDFSGVELNYANTIPVGEYAEMLPETANIDLYEVANSVLALPAPLLASVAIQYDAVSISSAGIKIDINAMLYGMYTKVVETIQSIELDTTVGDLINSDLVKGLIDAVTYDVTSAELVDVIIEVLDSGVIDAAIAAAGSQGNAGVTTYAVTTADTQVSVSQVIKALLPEAGEDESVHSYLVKVLNSEQIATALGMEGTVIADLTVESILALMATPEQQMPTLDELKATAVLMIETFVDCTETSFKVTGEYGQGFALSNSALNVTFAQSGDMSLSAEGSAVVTGISGITDVASGISERIENISEIDFSVQVNYSSQKQVLTDIDDCVCVIPTGEYISATQYVVLGTYTSENSAGQIIGKIELNGEVVTLKPYKALEIITDINNIDPAKLEAINFYSFTENELKLTIDGCTVTSEVYLDIRGGSWNTECYVTINSAESSTDTVSININTCVCNLISEGVIAEMTVGEFVAQSGTNS